MNETKVKIETRVETYRGEVASPAEMSLSEHQDDTKPRTLPSPYTPQSDIGSYLKSPISSSTTDASDLSTSYFKMPRSSYYMPQNDGMPIPEITTEEVAIILPPSTNEERRYKCGAPNCTRVFKRKEHLQRHFRSHTGEKPFQCTVCNKYFSRSDNLAAHMKHHSKRNSLSNSDPSLMPDRKKSKTEIPAELLLSPTMEDTNGRFEMLLRAVEQSPVGI
jgi:uncharacterized Zn-finger protein